MDLNTALYQAASTENISQCDTLIQQGASVNFREDQWPGETALHKAAENGNVEIASLLLKAGANINTPNNYNNTPLHRAAVNGNVELVHMLVQGGADVNTPGLNNKTPFQLAAECPNQNVGKGRYRDIVALLFDKFGDMNVLQYTSIPDEMSEIIRELRRKHLVDEPSKPKSTSVTLGDNATNNQPTDILDVNVDTQELKGTQPVDESLKPESTAVKLEDITTDKQPTDVLDLNVHKEDSDQPFQTHHKHDIDKQENAEYTEKSGSIISPDIITMVKDENTSNQGFQRNLFPQPEVISLDETDMKVIKNTPTKVSEEIHNEVFTKINSLNDKMDNLDKTVTLKLSEITDIIIQKVSENVVENLKISIEEVLIKVSDIVREGTQELKNDLGKLSKTTNEKIVTFTGDAEHNSFVDFQLFDKISRYIGQHENVGKWKKLAGRLFAQLPQHFSDEIIKKIDSHHTSEREKAYEVLVYWKTFAVNNTYTDLIQILPEVGLEQVQSEVKMIINIYKKDKERGHTGSLTEKGLCDLANNIGLEWERLGIHLDFQNSRLEQLRMDNIDVKTLIVKMLIEWRNKTPGSVEDKLNKLKKALEHVDHNDLAEKLTL